MRLFFNNNFTSKKASVFLYALYYTITSIVYIFFSSIIVNMISSLIATFLITLCYDSKFSKKIVVAVLNYVTINTCEMIVGAVVGLSGVNIFERTYYGDSFCLISVAILEFFVIKIIGKFKSIKGDAPIPKSYLFIAILVPCVSILFETLLFMQENISDVIYALSLICVVSLNFLVIYLYDSIS